ncbi:hypothetical protein ASPSYDRAFT_91762 [Aspergillus sydowii CBS 593.65]|uniref:Uncharacterized protein n=1 Tax=Aspergillus sydowii CBS 593.65 TaxID=1036612 RepID=A0A1L9TB15_9EURO|nr:uncharacterized protein ASPSYDRAFT_91762 [Aspergillus sydowii CBS 593.65]OJJ56503.1 hypothetical protein ASPSYDRAFT_91762 [Aspergillus sydowii CBS 593.65]
MDIPNSDTPNNQESSFPIVQPRLKLPRNPEILAPSLSRYLRKYNQYPSAPSVHPRPISFPTNQQKTNWATSLPDGKHRDTYAVWWRSPKHNKACWLGCFSTWTSSWVGDVKWDTRPWHAWAVAVLKLHNESGKCIIIYDCDPRIPAGYRYKYKHTKRKRNRVISVRPRRFLLPVQTKLIEHLRMRENVPIRAVFYNTDTRRAGRNRCVYYTMKWIRKVVRFGDKPFWGFDEEGRSLDPRTKRCALLDRL